jgi:tetratricopeptide (TPR) repeat protein
MTTMHAETNRARLARLHDYLALDPLNRALLAETIDLQLASGEIDDADNLVDKALSAYPDDPCFLHRRAHVLLARAELPEAERLLEHILPDAPTIGLAQDLALARFRRGAYAEAAAVLAPFVTDPALSADALLLYLRAMHQCGRIGQALDAVEAHEALCASDADLAATAGLMYFDEDRLDAARRWGDTAQALGAQSQEAWVLAGSLALAQGDGEAGLACFSEAVRRLPNDGRSWSGLGVANLMLLDAAAAEEHLNFAVQLMPRHIGSWHALAWSQLMQQNLTAAEVSFSRALAIDGNVGESHGGQAIVYAMRGERASAEESIRRALRLDANGLSARYARIVLAGDAGDPERFKQIARRVLGNREAPFGGRLSDWLR